MQVSSAKDAWAMLAGREFGAALGAKLRKWGEDNLWTLSDRKDGDPSGAPGHDRQPR